jgi:hypothetical protein
MFSSLKRQGRLRWPPNPLSNGYWGSFYPVDEFFIYVKMIHNITYTVKILCILYIYGLFHNPLSFWHTYGFTECMYVSTFVTDDCIYTYTRFLLTVPCCVCILLCNVSSYICFMMYRNTLLKWTINTGIADILWHDCVCVLWWLIFWI